MIIRPLIWWTPFFVSYLSAVVLPFVWYLSEFFFFWLIPTTEQQWVVIRRNFAGLLSFFFNQWTALNSSHKHKNINKKLSEISKSPDRRTKNFNYNNNRWKRACATPTTKQLARQEKKKERKKYICVNDWKGKCTSKGRVRPLTFSCPAALITAILTTNICIYVYVYVCRKGVEDGRVFQVEKRRENGSTCSLLREKLLIVWIVAIGYHQESTISYLYRYYRLDLLLIMRWYKCQ